MIDQEEKKKIVLDNQSHTFDTGSAEVQIALFTSRIQEISDHLQSNKHDYSSRRGLQKLVAKRKKLMSYLNLRNPEKYRALIQKLGIRG